MRRQETDLSLYAEMAQFWRRAARARWLIRLRHRLFQCVTDGFVTILRQRAAVRFEDNKGVHRHAIAVSENLCVVDAQIASVQLACDRGKQVRAVRAPDEDLRAR